MKRSSALINLPILLFFSITAISAKSLAAFDIDIEILRSDASGVTFRYIVPEASFAPFQEGAKGFSLLEIPRTAQNGREGQVEIPIKIVPLAMPPGSRPQIEVLESEYGTVPFKKIAPFFSEETREAYQKAYSSAAADNPVIPAALPHVSSSGLIRGLSVARIAIPIARYSLTPEELSLLKSITIRVNFDGGNERLAAGYRNPGQIYERILRRTVANYDDARSWFVPRVQAPLEAMAAQSSFDSAATWIRVELSSEGIYGFGWTHFSIAGVNPATVDPSRIRIFYGGGRELSVPNDQPRPELLEIPIKIIGGDDGSFDNGDLVVFYAEGVDGWQYNAQFNRFQYFRNHYGDKNAYWLTIDGDFSSPPRRIPAFNGSPDGAYDASVDSYEALFHKEQESIFYATDSGDIIDNFEWYWDKRRSIGTAIQLYDLVPGAQATVVARHQRGQPAMTVNGAIAIPGPAPQPNQTYSTYYSTALIDGANNIELNSSTDFFLDYIDVAYQRWLKVSDGSLAFGQQAVSGVVRYNLTQASANSILIDMTDRLNPVEITGGRLEGASYVFHDTVSAASHKRYSISSQERLKSPGAVALYARDNLRDTASPANRADEIIVVYDGFYDQAQRLADHRRTNFGLATRIVKLSEIYNQFSWGINDATAIRDFLKYAYENWPEPAPTFALLFGDGHYDYRNNLGHNIRNYVPPFENTTRVTDEHFIYFGLEGRLDSDTNLAPDMVIGRVNARSTREADEFVDKTIDYDSNPDLGSWRYRVVVVADDNLHPPISSNEDYHTRQAETLTNQHIPSQFEATKVYMIEYLMGPNGEKPLAREALMSAFNQGALIIDWIGHGSANLWADEHIFRRVEDLPRLSNGRRLPLIFTASCSIGRFDVPNIESMAEEFIRKTPGGAISVISATRDVFAIQNSGLNIAVFDQLLYSDSVGIGEALYVAKFLRSYNNSTDWNDRHYMVFGDPAQLLQFPKYDVRVVAAPDSLVALTVDSLSGEIVNDLGELQSDYNGTVWLTVKDGSTQRSIVCRDWINNPISLTIPFKAEGSTIFVGPADVQGGRFTSRFFVPKDVSYGSRGAKVFAYAQNNDYDALGVKDSILISGSLPSIQDSLGPSISLMVDGRPFSPGVTMVPTAFSLGAEINDEHGINITGQLGHAIVVSIDGGETYEGDVTGSFRYNNGDYRSGRLDVRLPGIPAGEHEISVKVWDNFNNSTLVTQRIVAVATDKLVISEVMNYPNPVRNGDLSTAFQYCLNEDVDKVSIKVFTEAGKKIKAMDLTSEELTRMNCSQVPWDLLDADGDRLANGIYLYKITAEKRDVDGGRKQADETGKLVILR